jgi:hypothetical protein
MSDAISFGDPRRLDYRGAAGSHAIYIAKPEAVATLIAKVAKNVSSQMAA